MWRREPFRLLFPLGALLAWAGVLPWLFFSLGATSLYAPLNGVLAYRSYLHPVAELEGFLGCFALGLVFTISPPAWWELSLALIAPLFAAALAAMGRWEAGQALWLLLLTVVVLRFRRGPAGLWLFAGVVLGASGSVLAGVTKEWWLRELGRDLVMQGMFTALAVGAARALRGDRGGTRYLDVLGIAFFAASFWVGARDKPHLGFALRALVLISAARPLRPPFEVGPRTLRLFFPHLALWMMAGGTAWIAALTQVRRAGLHVMFLGAFAALLCSGFTRLRAPGRRLAWTAGLFSLSMLGRVMVELDPPAFHIWMGTSAASFLAASVLCALMPANQSKRGSAQAETASTPDRDRAGVERDDAQAQAIN
jgi:uncharacterized protein involved in response to NO